MSAPTSSGSGIKRELSSETFRGEINEMDAISQEHCANIEAIARLARTSFKAPNGVQLLNEIETALMVIEGQAFDLMDTINSRAERLGCNFVK